MKLLDITVIERITRRILPKEFSYNIRKSERTDSIYLTIVYNELETSIRFSDHASSNTAIKTILITENTKKKKVERTILKSAVGIRELSLQIALGLKPKERNATRMGKPLE